MPTITIPVEDLVFVVCTLVGGGLLLVTVLVDDILGGIFDAFHISFDIGGVSLMPLLLAFVSMFGVGGLMATQVFDIHGGQAALVGSGFGAVGFGLTYALFQALRRSEGESVLDDGRLSRRHTRHSRRAQSTVFPARTRPACSAASIGSSRPAWPTAHFNPYR